ncbi:MAG: transposase [Gluconobacter sp.]|uniref:transposase n=1 Tax=Gluconobacter sp. TaxID=1876758 RepID=UPI0039E94A91
MDSFGMLLVDHPRLYEQNPCPCDNQGRPRDFVLTAGPVSDYKATGTLMKLPVPHPKAMLADRGYGSDSFHQDLDPADYSLT